MRKCIDRSRILRKDFGCYEKKNKSNKNLEIIDNFNSIRDNNNFHNSKNYNYEDNQNNSSIKFNNLSPHREFDKDESIDSSKDNSNLMRGSTKNMVINKNYNEKSPLIKEEARQSYYNYYRNQVESRSPNRNFNSISEFDNNNTNYKNIYQGFSQSNGFSKNKFLMDTKLSSQTRDTHIGSLTNLSMFTVKSDRHIIKSQNLARYLYDLIIVDSLSESNKESLSLRTDISLIQLFRLFDISNRNSISLVDFQEMLKELEIFVPLPELKLTFKRFDIDMDGRLE